MKRDKNKELMLAAGSKKGDYDPEAPDQWKWLLRHGESPTEVVMAWIKSKTIAFRHDSPFCVDEHGKPLYIPHMAADLGWEEQTARNVLTELEGQGRARFKGSAHAAKAKRIWYCADIPQAHQGGEEKGNENNSVQSYLPAYLADFIKTLPTEKQPAALAKWKRCFEWRREFFADGMAALRNIADRIEDTTVEEIGVPKKRLPKRRTAEAKWVQLSLVAAPNFVQSFFPEFVQNGKAGSYKEENDFVDARAVVSTAAPSSTGGAAAPQSPSSPVLVNKTNRPAGRPMGWHAELREILKTLPIGTDLDEPMFQRIAQHLNQELLPQFKAEAEKAKGEIRKWAGYEAKAKQVAARGLVKAADAGSAPAEESYVQRRAREIVANRSKQEKNDG